MDESHAVLLARVDENVEHLRADFERFRDELPDLTKRVSSLERHRSWLVGVVAAISALLGRKEVAALLGLAVGVLVGGCAHSGPVRAGPVRMLARPVKVLVDPALPSCEQDAVRAAVVFWRGKDVRVDVLPWSSRATAGRGAVAFEDEDILRPTVLGTTLPTRMEINPGRPEVWAALVHLDTCSPWVATHELGHALGLPHREEKDALMHPYFEGWKLTEEELSWVK